MILNNVGEEFTQEKAIKMYIKFLGYIFLIGIISSILTFIILIFLSDELISISFNIYRITVLLILLPLLMLALVLILYILPIPFNRLKDKSKLNIDFKTIIKEQKKPTKILYRIRQIILWILSITTVLTIIASIIYLITVFLLN